MKLEKILIENFRGIERVELDFQDEIGRVPNVIPIVGPNTSGKTTILDAISLCLGPGTELFRPRQDLVVKPASLVRRGKVRAHVECVVRFSDEEIAKTMELFQQVGDPDSTKIPHANVVEISWDYPDPTGEHWRGRNKYTPNWSYLLFKGRKRAIRHFHAPDISARHLQILGGVYMFDQKRTGLGSRLPKSVRSVTEAQDRSVEYTQNAREILLDLATRAQAKQGPETTEKEDYDRFRELYNKVCNPHTIKGLYNTESGLDMEFEGPQGVYLYDGLSSGQIMLLMLLVQFARNRIHNSIVLIDELELHLHPLWQTRLYANLENLGTNNQIFFTTHSTHLRESMHRDFYHCTGELGDESVKKVEP